jgi:hypothetical protein
LSSNLFIPFISIYKIDIINKGISPSPIAAPGVVIVVPPLCPLPGARRGPLEEEEGVLSEKGAAMSLDGSVVLPVCMAEV